MNETSYQSRRARLAACAGAAVVLALAGAASAAAKPRIANVDLSQYPSIRVTVITSERTVHAPRIREDGELVHGVTAENFGRANSVVLAIDRSRSMRGKALPKAVAAASRFVALKPEHDRIAIVTFASQTIVATRLSSSAIDADSALRTLIPGDSRYGTTLYDAIVLSSRMLARSGSPGRVILLVTDGQETTSKATLGQAIRAARKAHALVYTVAIESQAFSPGPLKKLARQTGGTYYGASSSAELPAIYEGIARRLSRTWRLEYLTAARPGDRIRLSVTERPSASATTVVRIPGASPTPESSNQTWLIVAIASILGLIVLVSVSGRLFRRDPYRRRGGRSGKRSSEL